jgi:hypothetical protein
MSRLKREAGNLKRPASEQVQVVEDRSRIEEAIAAINGELERQRAAAERFKQKE